MGIFAAESGAARANGWLRAAILAVLLLAAALRWWAPALVEFKYDEAHVVELSLNLARGGALPLLSGGTSFGIQRGALDVYLLVLPLKLAGGRVEAAVWLLGALGVLAAALTYLLGRQIAGPRVGLLAALFMAANPWLVFYDRKLWAHIQVILSVALLLLAWRVVVRGGRRAVFWFPMLAAMQLLAHLLALLQALSWLMALLVAPRRWLRREMEFGLLAAAALLAPYLWALGQRGVNLPAGPAESVARAGTAPAAALSAAARLLTGEGLHVLAALPRSASAAWQITDALLWPLVALLAIGLLRTVVSSFDRRNIALHGRSETSATRPGLSGAGARLLLAWTVAPALPLVFGPLQPPLQYWTALLPLPALYLALGLDWAVGGAIRIVASVASASAAAELTRSTNRRAVAGWALALVPALALSGVWVASYGDLLAAVGRGAGAVTFGPSLAAWNAAVGAARAWADRLGTQEVRVAVNGVDPGYDGEPAAVAALIGNPPFARFVAPTSPSALLLAHDRPSLYLWAVDAPETERQLAQLGELVWAGELAAGHPPARLYRLPPAAAGLDIQRLDPPPVFDVGLMLVGYKLPEAARAGTPFEAILVWRVLDPPPTVRTRDLTAFNHILDAQGKSAAQADGLALLSRDWWPGDVLIQPYSLALPAGTYRWRTGIYSRQDGGRAQATMGGDSVDLPRFAVK